MRGAKRRVTRLGTVAETTSQPALIVALDDGDGTLRHPTTGTVLAPPAGALIVVIGERPDGPQ